MTTYAGKNIDEIIIERETVEDEPVRNEPIKRYMIDERGNVRPIRG